ncbi:Steroid nuclear receptor ligand-binding [Melia azedarach]|uniref:Steroid nuclear receptor ligand-binding n=1 Tax=Melia azedarach TaxID=155640 RepID=A0ACC1Z2R5_MELAZ|nr:Steroid nuclear receptor ligand-binding [Melia azedarach]
MKVPVGFLEKLWSFLSFLPYFFLLFILGLLKAAIIGPIVVGIILTANSAVIIGKQNCPLHLLNFCNGFSRFSASFGKLKVKALVFGKIAKYRSCRVN